MKSRNALLIPVLCLMVIAAFAIWVKDDIAEVVPTPPFFLSSNNKAKPPRLTADRAAFIAEMKTGLGRVFALTTQPGTL